MHVRKMHRGQVMLNWIVFLAVANTMDGQIYPGEILTGPQTQVVVPGEIAHFICHALGESVYWYINNTDPHPQSIYETKGFSFSYTVLSDPRNGPEEHNNTITVEARPSNNSTRITCNAIGTYNNQHAFQEGTLIIAGPPSAPVVTLTQEYKGDGFVNSIFSWNAPFTFPGYPVTNYTVTMFNHSDNTSQRETRPASFAAYQFTIRSYGNYCYEIDFTAVAFNILGKSPPATLHTGHPIVQGDIKEMEAVITTLFQTNTSHLQISFLAPWICPYFYQTGFYNITIYDFMCESVIYIGPLSYTQMNKGQNNLITENFTSDLLRDEHFIVEVVVTSVGVTRAMRINIGTNYSSTHDHTATNTQQGYSIDETTSGSQTTLSSGSSQPQVELSLAVSISVVLAVFSFGVIMIIIIGVMCRVRYKRKSKGCTQKRSYDHYDSNENKISDPKTKENVYN